MLLLQSLLSTFAGMETVKGYDGADLLGMQGNKIYLQSDRNLE